MAVTLATGPAIMVIGVNSLAHGQGTGVPPPIVNNFALYW